MLIETIVRDLMIFMEPDRYKQNHFSYITGLCCLFLSLGLFAFSLYLLPYLFFSWQYNIPEFITLLDVTLKDNYDLSESGAAWVMILILDFPAVILFIIADVLSNRIDKQIYGISQEKRESSVSSPNTSKESRGLVLKILMIIIVIFIVAQFFHWVISST